MKAICVGDTAGGVIVSTLQSLVNINGRPWAVQGAVIASHGDDEHSAAVLPVGFPPIKINGVPVILEGAIATCGHVAVGIDPLVQVVP